MKLKNGYVLRKVADTYVVLPLKNIAVELDGMLSLNDSGAMLWRVLEQGGDMNAMIETLTSEYDVSMEQAINDVKEFIDQLIQAGCIEM